MQTAFTSVTSFQPYCIPIEVGRATAHFTGLETEVYRERERVRASPVSLDAEPRLRQSGLRRLKKTKKQGSPFLSLASMLTDVNLCPRPAAFHQRKPSPEVRDWCFLGQWAFLAVTGSTLAKWLLECQNSLEFPEGGFGLHWLPHPAPLGEKGVQLWKLALLPTLPGN